MVKNWKRKNREVKNSLEPKFRAINILSNRLTDNHQSKTDKRRRKRKKVLFLKNLFAASLIKVQKTHCVVFTVQKV